METTFNDNNISHLHLTSNKPFLPADSLQVYQIFIKLQNCFRSIKNISNWIWSPDKTNPAVAKIANHTGCQWPSVIPGRWFPSRLTGRMPLPTVLVINSNLGRISHGLRNMVSFPLTMHIFPTPSIQPRVWKSSFCTRWLKFCTPEFNTCG